MSPLDGRLHRREGFVNKRVGAARCPLHVRIRILPGTFRTPMVTTATGDGEECESDSDHSDEKFFHRDSHVLLIVASQTRERPSAGTSRGVRRRI